MQKIKKVLTFEILKYIVDLQDKEINDIKNLVLKYFEGVDSAIKEIGERIIITIKSQENNIGTM